MSERVVLSRAGLQRFEQLQEKYRPKRNPTSASPVAVELGQVAVTLCREELTHAREAFEAFRWTDSAKRYGDVRRHAEALRAVNPELPEVDAVIASATLGEATSRLNLQDTVPATSLLATINEAALTDRQRCILATALVQIDDTVRAQRVLGGVSAEYQVDTHYREARQIVDLLGGGQLPTAPLQTASVFNVLAQHYLNVQLVGKAGASAREGLALGAMGPVLRASLLASAMVSLLRTIFEDDVADEGIPIAARREHAELIADLYPEIYRAGLPDSTRRMLLGVGLNYASSLRERKLLRWILENTDEEQRNQLASLDGAKAFALAGEGRISDAIAALPRADHPWRFELQRCQLLAFAGDGARALDELVPLSTRWPNRFPIHATLAELLSDLDRHREATDHAESAFALLPTDSVAELFARCLANSEQGARALVVLGERPTNEHVAELRAYAAEQAHDAAAAALWRDLLRYRPESRAASLGLALALTRTGDSEAAARQARDLVGRDLNRLSRDELAACGQILSLARFLPGTDDLIRKVAEELRVRFSGDDTAEFQRLTLVSALGFPDGVAPIDYARLARSGHIKSISVDDVVDLLGKRRELAAASHRAYSEGWLTFASFAELTGIRTANVIIRSTASRVATRLRAPIQPNLSERMDDLRGKTFLCTSLELLLLGHCRVLDRVPDAIKGARLITTHDEWSTLLEDAYFLEHAAQRDEAARLRSLITRVSTPQIVKADHQGDERIAATAHGCRFVTTTPTADNDLDALTVVSSLASSGRLSRSDLENAARCLGKELAAVTSSTVPSLPLYFEIGLLDLLHRANVLDAVLESTERVVVSARDVELARSRLEDLELAASAAMLQRQVVQRLGEAQREGWFDIIPSPPPASLPPLQEGVEQQHADLLTHSIRQLLPLKALLSEHADWRRVTADSFGFDTVGHRDQWRIFAFTPAEGQAYFARHWLRANREISLSRFVRALMQGPQRPAAVRTLARLGFTDVIHPSDIVDLADEFGRVDAGTPGEVLDGAEAAAGDLLAHGVACRMHLGIAYAQAAWHIVGSKDFERLRTIPRQLIERLEKIDAEHSTRLVEQALGHLILLALDNREASFVKAKDDRYKIDRSTPAGQLWTVFAEWQEGNPSREAATRRAVAHAWEALGDHKNGPTTQAQWGPVALATDILAKRGGVNTDVPSPDAVVAVMSANWEEKPLANKEVTFTLGESRIDRSIEDLLQAAGAVLAEDGKRNSDGTSIWFEFRPGPERATARVGVPFEAALLRTIPAAASHNAVGLAINIGIFDGRLYRALVDFAGEPTNEVFRKSLARAACDAPFRLVSDDPQFLLRLGDRAAASQHDFPTDLDELRELLSEPSPMLTGELVGVDEVEIVVELARRLNDGGFWAQRRDKAQLVHFASRYPGRLPAEAARSLFENTDRDEFREIASVLRSSTNRSMGELAVATALAAYGCFSDQEESLKGDLVGALSAMLEMESKAPEAPCIASIEPAVLERVARTVGRLSLVPIPIVEHAWLTQRLYEWWIRLASFEDLAAIKHEDAAVAWHEVRTEIVLNVLLDVLEVQVIAHSRDGQPLSSLVPKLLQLASSRYANPFEPARRVQGWLYWRRPQGAGWLSSSLALWIDPNAFFELRPEIRLAVLDRLPRTAVDAEKNGVSFASFVPALSRYISRLTSPEVEAVRAWLNGAESSGLLDLWRADVLTGFVAAHGDVTDAAQLRALAQLETVAKARTELLVAYLEAVASSEHVALHETVFELAEAIEAAEGADVHARAISLALGRPRADVVKSLLISLEQQASSSERHRGAVFVQAIRSALAAKESGAEDST